MAIIVAGKLNIKPGSREAFIGMSRETILQARANEACDDFSVSPDPIDIHRVNIYEKWKTRTALDAFRGSDAGSDIFSLVVCFDVNEYEINT